jgi:hypothetical protein
LIVCVGEGVRSSVLDEMGDVGGLYGGDDGVVGVEVGDIYSGEEEEEDDDDDEDEEEDDDDDVDDDDDDDEDDDDDDDVG